MITPIPRLDAFAERALLADLIETAPDLLLITSDLHLGAGCDPLTGTTLSVENFLSDGAFARFLEHFTPRANSALLVLNGDIFDFLRITGYPRSNAELQDWADRLARLDETDRARNVGADLTRSERVYGLRTHDYKTVWKLMVIARGHPGFFEALAAWVTAGGRVALNRGNHDPELHWPLVRQALRDELVLRGASVDAALRLAFIDETVVVQNVYVEHGHNYESMTRIDGPAVLKDDPEQISLPLGSFVNRYFINRIELLNPFIDNIKPINDALLALLRKYPLSIFGTYVRAWRFLWKAIQARRFNGAVLTITLGLIVPILTIAAVIAIKVSPQLAQWVHTVMPVLDGVRARFAAALGILFPVILPYLLGLLTQIWRELLRVTGLRKPGRDEYAQGAAESLRKAIPAAAGFARAFAVLGHTHVQRVELLQAAPREELYVNTGTWIPLWPKDRPDLNGRVIRSFSKFQLTTEGYEHQAMEWDDSAGEPRPALILSFATPEN